MVFWHFAHVLLAHPPLPGEGVWWGEEEGGRAREAADKRRVGASAPISSQVFVGMFIVDMFDGCATPAVGRAIFPRRG